MDRLASMQAFVKVADCAGFSAAARRLHMSTTMVSNHVQALENRLGARLFNRTTRKVSLTDIGREYYERCTQILAELEEADHAASALQAAPRGRLRAHCDTHIVRDIAPAIADFLAAYPEVSVELAIGERMVDLVEEGFDLAIRIGPPGADNLVARKLGETRLVPCASPAYLATHGAPATPEDLARHNCFTYEYVSPRHQWRFRDRSGAERSVRVSGTLHSNNGDLLAEAAARGAGVVFEPAFIVGPDVRAGRLVPLLQEYEPPPVPIYAVYPSRKHLSAKVRRFVEFLAARFADAQDWSSA